ncbi:MAG: TPM domain-containing protein [Tissierellaceae bacterium]
MKAKLQLSMLLLLIITILLPGLGFAREIPEERLLPRLVDDAGLLTRDQEMSLVEKLDEISERQKLDIVVATVDSLGQSTPTEYADDFFDYNGYGFGDNADGILLLLSMEERDWAVSTTGYGITVFTDAGQEYLMGKVLEELREGNYYKGFDLYADLCDDFINQAKDKKPYDNGNMPKEPLSPKWIPISIFLGAIVSFIITGSMKRKLKSVSMQRAASSYLKDDSLKLGASRDLFLYTVVSKRERPKESSSSTGSSTHTSSSGRSHGGSSGKF